MEVWGEPRRGEVWAQIVVTADRGSLVCLSHSVLTAKGIAELENLIFHALIWLNNDPPDINV